jgi:acetyl-CoA synthetase (ADP-forming)
VTRTLSEASSKAFLAEYGVPVPAEHLVASAAAAVVAADAVGYPVVVKLCGDALAHKTERGLVRLRLRDAAAVTAAATALLAVAGPDDGDVALLVAPMVVGNRELIAGVVDDATFGRAVMAGVGGILAEAFGDVAFRLVPVSRADAAELLDDLATQALFGPLRGEPAIDREAVIDLLVALSAAAAAHPELVSVDLNPLVVVDGRPVAVDALVELRE